MPSDSASLEHGIVGIEPVSYWVAEVVAVDVYVYVDADVEQYFLFAGLI